MGGYHGVLDALVGVCDTATRNPVPRPVPPSNVDPEVDGTDLNGPSIEPEPPKTPRAAHFAGAWSSSISSSGNPLYSARSAIIGSTRVARRAGTSVATSETIATSATTAL